MASRSSAGKEAPGGHPLREWTPGKIYADEYEFQVDPAAPSGEYSLEIGWFLPESGERLKPSAEVPASSGALQRSHLDSLLLPGIFVE